MSTEQLNKIKQLQEEITRNNWELLELVQKLPPIEQLKYLDRIKSIINKPLTNEQNIDSNP